MHFHLHSVWWRYLAAASWIGVVGYSLTPLPRSRFYGRLGQLTVFFTAALVTRLAFPHVESRFQIASFALAAIALETIGFALPNRRPGIDRLTAGIVGAIAGVIIMRTFAHERNL